MIRRAGQTNEAKKNTETLEKIRELLYKLYSAKNNLTAKKLNDFFKENQEIQSQIRECQDPELYYAMRRITSNITDAHANLIARQM